MRQLFCHLSLPEPLQFSVWVPVTIPAMCLCCHLSFLSTVCIYHGSQNKALKHSRSTVLLGLSLFWLLKQESQLWPAVQALEDSESSCIYSDFVFPCTIPSCICLSSVPLSEARSPGISQSPLPTLVSLRVLFILVLVISLMSP